jgi:hypothetical protein
MNSPPPYDLVIGLDRSDAKADLHLIDTRTGRQRSLTIDTSPEALWEWLLELRQQYLKARVGICLEQPAVHLLPFLAEAFAAHRDHDLFASLPGAGPVLALRLLASLGSHRERFASARELQQYRGVAQVTKKSGGTCHIHRRHLCATFQRQSFHEYAKESILWSRWSAAYYLQQRTKGSSHHTAVRALAFKWQRIIWRCWQDHSQYDERIYEAALRRSRSPLVALFSQIEPGKSPFKTA